jgi:phospholipase A1/A2
MRAVGVLAFEHESNGRDSIFSRSWNRVSFTFFTALSRNATLTARAWIPFSYREENPDLLRYVGYGDVTFTYQPSNKRWFFDLSGRYRAIETQFSYRLNKKSNQYIGVQWFSGYAETLIDYQRVNHMLRIGLMIKPDQ